MLPSARTMGFSWKVILLLGVTIIPSISSKTVNKTSISGSEKLPIVSSTTKPSDIPESTIRSGLRSARFGLENSESKQPSGVFTSGGSEVEKKKAQSSPGKSQKECEVVFRDLVVPTPGSATKKSKVRLACTICYQGGYQEECAFVSKDSGHVSNKGKKGLPFEKHGQESRFSDDSASPRDDDAEEDDDDSSVPVYQESKDNTKYLNPYKKTAKEESFIPFNREEPYLPVYADSSDSNKRYEEFDSNHPGHSPDFFEGHESRDDSGEQADDKKSSDDPLDFAPIHIIPKEYMDPEYDPKFYESHDAAANIFHSANPFGSEGIGRKTKDPSGEDSSQETSGESKKSEKMVLPGMDMLRSYLPDVEPLNPDKDIEPRKRSKTIEFTEQISFSSDEDDDKNKGKGSRQTSSSGPHPSYHFGGDDKSEENSHQPSSSQQEQERRDPAFQYNPPIPMPRGEDTKNCKVSYRDSPSGGKKKMKCMMCGGKDHKGFSEECSVEYDEPTKHHEVYYGKQNYNDDPKVAKQLVYGSGNVPYAAPGNAGQQSQIQGIPYYIPYYVPIPHPGLAPKENDKKQSASNTAQDRSAQEIPSLPVGYYTDPKYHPH